MKTMILTISTAAVLSFSMAAANAGESRRGGSQTGISSGGLVNVSPNVNLGDLKLLNNIGLLNGSGILNGNKTGLSIGGILNGVGIGIANGNVRNEKPGRRR